MEKSIFEQLGGTYTLGADGMYYPDLSASEEEPAHYGKYGRIRKTFLQKHRHSVYLELLPAGKLTVHLNEVNDTAREQVDLLVRQIAEKRGVTESLKTANQIAWVGAMNQIKYSAQEIVLSEWIYNWQKSGDSSERRTVSGFFVNFHEYKRSYVREMLAIS